MSETATTPRIELGSYLTENWPKWTSVQRYEWLCLFRDTFYDGPSKEDPAFTQAEMDLLNVKLGEAETAAEFEKQMIEHHEIMRGYLDRSEKQLEDFRQKIELQKQRHDILLGEKPQPKKRDLGN